jgi:hypothetical protein
MESLMSKPGNDHDPRWALASVSAGPNRASPASICAEGVQQRTARNTCARMGRLRCQLRADPALRVTSFFSFAAMLPALLCVSVLSLQLFAR